MLARPIIILLVLLIGVIFNACQSKNKPSGTHTAAPESNDFYQEIISYSGIDFEHTIGDDHLSTLVESVGGGAASWITTRTAFTSGTSALVIILKI